MTKTTWLVVADEAIARILQYPKKGHELESVEEMTDPTAHASGTELRRDAHGRRGESITASAGESAKHLQAENFAARLATRLNEALSQHRFEELRIAAAPRFLGLLRKALNPNVARTVTLELDKDLVQLSHDDLLHRCFPERVRQATH